MDVGGARHLRHEQRVDPVERQARDIRHQLIGIDRVDADDPLPAAEIERLQRIGDGLPGRGLFAGRDAVLDVEGHGVHVERHRLGEARREMAGRDHDGPADPGIGHGKYPCSCGFLRRRGLAFDEC